MKWFDDAIRKGLQGLVIMRVQGHPPAEQFDNVARIWVGSLAGTRNWNEPQDAARIAEAFKQLTLSAKRWPSISDFLDVLPMRGNAPAQTVPVQRQLADKTDERPDAEHRARMLARFNQRMAEYIKSPERIAQMEQEREGFEYKGKKVRIPWTDDDIYGEWVPCISLAEALARAGTRSVV